ncbi:histidine kinase [Marinomonas agarivorans]|nr:histidine kinase [Marinomonas agarivorans]
MKLKSKILLLTIAPLICVTAIISYLGFIFANNLAEQELKIYEYNLIKVKKEALKDQSDLAFSAIQSILANSAISDSTAKAQVKKLLSELTYGEDGYFFVYDEYGVNLVHPTQPDFIGQNLWEFEDTLGNPLIKLLIQAAQNGGGYHRYLWEKPSTGQQEEKISYAAMIERWQWMFGTGLYLDDIYNELEKAEAIINQNIQNSFIVILLIVTITIILVILLGLGINLHEHRLADQRLKDLIQRFIRLQVSERRKFSRELHDGINQLLVSCKFRIELAIKALNKGSITSDIQEHLDLADHGIVQSIQEIRQISHDLRPALLDDLGLKAALKTLLDEFIARTKMQVETHFTFDETSISDDTEIILYRLIQECLSNVEKHAQASKLILVIEQKHKRLEFKCLDNGSGFNMKDRKLLSGIGLRNMRERVELISGEFSCRSALGKGTEIKASLEDIAGSSNI